MAIKNKLWYSEQVLNQLAGDALRNRDEKIDQREVLLVLDNIVNEMAKQGFLENWKMGVGGVSENYLTSFEWLTVTDPSNNGPSFFNLPVNFASLPKEQGIQDIYFQNDFSSTKKKYFDPVIITSFKDNSSYRSQLSFGLQGRLACYPKNGIMYFTQGSIFRIYGNVGCRLVIRDSSQITDDALYPVPADKENELIQKCVAYFTQRKILPVDMIRDKIDKQSNAQYVK